MKHVASVLLSLATGCGATSGHAANGDRHGASSGDTARTSTSNSCSPERPAPAILQQRFESLAHQVAADGIHFNGIVASGFITHGTNITTPIDVPAGTCLSIVALASPSIHDLDAHLFSPDGEIIVEDIEPDPHPTVQLCATEPRRVYHVIETYVSDQNASEGHGAYAIGTFQSDRHGLEAFAHIVGGRPGTALSTSANGTDAERRLSELRDGIARRGFQTSGDVIRAQFAAAGALRFPIPVTPDHCYTLAALAEGTIADTDLSVYDRDGEEIARDIRPDRDAFVQLCPTAAETLTAEVRARPGPGWVLLQPFAADAAAVGGANTLWLGERLGWGASATPLAQSIDAGRQVLQAQGFRSAATPTTVTFAPGESHEQHATVEPGHCTAVATMLGRGLGRTDLALYAPNGDFVARGARHGASTVAIVCPPAREDLTVRMRAEVGSGDAAFGTFQGASPPAWTTAVDRVAVSEALAVQFATVASGWRADGTPERLRVGARAVRTRDVDLAAGSCTRLVVSAGAGLPNLELALRAPNGTVVAQGGGDGSAMVTRCVNASERARLEVAIDPPGPVEFDAVLQRFVRPPREGGH